ncbi:uncharacterized protein LOC131875318 [Cryptomeria japonica]|uniref:uncharacterized protein LOC131875318 n=1 Tax=Cryptomeria japonica TaxID=3369 RepID=UPI0027DA8EFC|nr:uncharacterized protein LOC131875318 [Cryptomeria japonica]
MIAKDKVTLDACVKSMQDSLSEGGNLCKSCLSQSNFTADIEKKSKAHEDELECISHSVYPLSVSLGSHENQVISLVDKMISLSHNRERIIGRVGEIRSLITPKLDIMLNALKDTRDALASDLSGDITAPEMQLPEIIDLQVTSVEKPVTQPGVDIPPVKEPPMKPQLPPVSQDIQKESNEKDDTQISEQETEKEQEKEEITKVSAIKEAKDLKTFSMDELFGLFSAYEMRTVSVEPSKKEVTFTSEKKGKEVASSVDDEESDAAKASFILDDEQSGAQSENLNDSEEEDVDVEVDLEGELIRALEELDSIRKEYTKYKKSAIKEQNQLSKKLEESKMNINTLKTQLEKSKRKSEVIKLELESKEKESQKLEEEIVNLRKELEKCKDDLKLRLKCEINTNTLDDMLKKQNHSKDSMGIGYEVGQCSSRLDSSKTGIHFVSSSMDGNWKTLTVSNAPRKKIDLNTTTESVYGENG